VALVAAVGWIDDHRSLSVSTRLIGHLVAGAIVAALASGAEVRPFHVAIPAVLGVLWWVFWTVSAINVVNFIDGIDGIIGLQAFVYGLFAVAAVGLHASPAAILALTLAGAALGFLLLNWSPARIFMGDVGSGSLGVIFVVLGVLTMREVGWSVVPAFLPLMPIFADEVLTMSRRLARGESLSEPHRTHVYQRLVQAGWGHGPVAALYGLLAAICGAWALIERGGTPVFWVGAGIALVATFGLLGLLRGWAERQCGAAPVGEVSVAS
jgi:UDP-N-acetylmuramyl pentapeptide phosphotransferase/UDP-N-acetylglucosamine-1-phosphate transferase